MMLGMTVADASIHLVRGGSCSGIQNRNAGGPVLGRKLAGARPRGRSRGGMSGMPSGDPVNQDATLHPKLVAFEKTLEMPMLVSVLSGSACSSPSLPMA